MESVFGESSEPMKMPDDLQPPTAAVQQVDLPTTVAAVMESEQFKEFRDRVEMFMKKVEDMSDRVEAVMKQVKDEKIEDLQKKVAKVVINMEMIKNELHPPDLSKKEKRVDPRDPPKKVLKINDEPAEPEEPKPSNLTKMFANVQNSDGKPASKL